ncbi:MAG: O-antigen ligase family protein [Phototrophicaceae bacterium]
MDNTQRPLRQVSYNEQGIRVALQLFAILATVATAILGSYIIGSTTYGLYVVVAVLGAITSLVVINKPSLGVYILVVFIYLDFSSVIEITFGIPSINKVLVALVAVSILGTKVTIRRENLVFGVSGTLIIFHSLIMIATILVSELSPNLDLVVDIVKDLAILFIILQVSSEERSFKTIQWLMLASAAFLALLTTYQLLSGNYEFEFWGLAQAPIHQIIDNYDDVRPTGPLDDPNFYAQILLMVLPVGIYRVLGTQNSLRRLIALFACAVIAFAVIGTYSRSAFVTFVVVAALIAIEQRVQLYKIATIVIVGVLIGLPLLPRGFMERVATLTEFAGAFTNGANSVTEVSLRGRTSEILVAWELFTDYPVFGVGYGNYPQYYQEYAAGLGLDNRLEERDAHSLYFEYLAETGLIGFSAFIIMLGVIFNLMMRAKKQMREIDRLDMVYWIAGAQMGLVAYLVNTITLHDDYIRYLRLSLAMAAGVIILSRHIYKEALAESKHKNKNEKPKVIQAT